MRNKILKFRAWDGLNKKFTYWTMNDLCTYSEKDEKPSALDDWQQDTGLLDRHGKEIYEGDILLIPDEDVVPITDEGQGPIEPCNHIVPVEFREGEFGFEIPKSDDGETGWFTWNTWSEIDDPKEIEIIGNIYENKELLT